jgi:hypothetical protein
MNRRDLQRSTRSVPATNAKIKASGRIHLGRLLKLEQATQLSSPTKFRFNVGIASSGLVPAIDNPMPQGTPGQLPVDRLEWSLRETSEELYVTGTGLTTSYGIFGAPRSGKTYLLLYLLRQLFSLSADDPDRRFGGLILDPKAALIEDVQTAMAAANRTEDLVILNADELMRLNQAANVIDAELDPAELGRALVLAAKSAGIGAADEFWFGAWTNLFEAAMQVLDWTGEQVPTVCSLMDAVMLIDGRDGDGKPERRIQRLAREASQRVDPLQERGRDLQMAIDQIDAYYRQDVDIISNVEVLMTQAYSRFRQSRWSRYSRRELMVKGRPRARFYDEIIDDGKVVLVSISPEDPKMARVLCTLIKVLFQQTVLSRSARVRARTLRNFVRPVLLACDEYSEVASEVPGEPMGDGHFFSLASQNGCMGLIATQSVNVLQASSLKENWRSVFSNFGAKIFMRLVDNETADEATKLAGESDWYVTSLNTSQQKDGTTTGGRQTELRERKSLPTSILTQVLRTGQGAFIGSFDGGDTRPGTFFLSVPKYD